MKNKLLLLRNQQYQKKISSKTRIMNSIPFHLNRNMFPNKRNKRNKKMKFHMVQR